MDELRMNETPPPVVAAVDIGSNSVKMTVARRGPNGGLDELGGASEPVRLGAGVDATGRLDDDRVERAIATLLRFAKEARALGATRLVGVATEATRVAANGPAFLDRVGTETGWTIRSISGDAEAALSFRGIATETDLRGEVVVADIGGGSTETVVARDGAILSATSIPLGSGRLTDRLVPEDPPTAAAIAACRAAAGERIAALDLPPATSSRLVVVGGTGEYLLRLVGDAVPATVGVPSIDAALERLGDMSSDQLAEAIGIPAARARVLPAGVAIIRAFADRVQPARVEIARSGIRTGLLLDALDDAAKDRGD
ncbi:MAG: Exopolyphosphatase [uncultured Thermomicrobiales bacterium]|uniref:Exopolyphosphatase n=1 Tax=uncultured Thermomicrobiales bacterium TaxID=1645740 RepID=A0A6J4V5A9_9BACT|nr:MAG: Exopolyphosphatase [uncultured Thermomicrobiales bacterium]